MLGWIGTGLLLAGAWGVGNRARLAFLLSITGEAIWTANAYRRSDWALATVCVAFGLVALRNFLAWGKP